MSKYWWIINNKVAREATDEINRWYAEKLAASNNKPMVTGYKQVEPIKQNTAASKPIIAAPKQVKQTKPKTEASKPLPAAPKPRKTAASKPISAGTTQKPKNNIYSKKETLEYIKDPSKINKNNVGKLVRSVMHWNENKNLNINKIQYQSYTSLDAGSYDTDDLLKLSQYQLYNQYNKLRGIYLFNKKLSEQQIVDAYTKNSSDESLAEKYVFIKDGFNDQLKFETIAQLTSKAQDMSKDPILNKFMHPNIDNIDELRNELVRDRLGSLYKNLKLNNDDAEKQFSRFKKSYETFEKSHKNIKFESFKESVRLMSTIKKALGVDDIAGLSNLGYGSDQFLEGGRLHNLGDYVTLDELDEIVDHYKKYRNSAETKEAGSSVGINEYLIDVFDEISKHSSTKSLGLVKTKQDKNTRHAFIKAMYNSGKYNTED